MKRWLPVAIVLVLLAVLSVWYGPYLLRRSRTPIRVGLLHSKTGPLAISELSMIAAEQLAIEEINAAGGVLGRQVEAVEADGRSDARVFAQEAHRLIETEKVSVLFGCWSALSRRTVKAVVESTDHLLFFPSNYEGMDVSPNVVTTGPIPNQQVIPAVNWCFETLKARKFFLAGSQDPQPYTVNALIKDQLKALGATLAGEKYVSLAGEGVPDLVAAIKAAAPDVVLSTVIGDGNKPFYQQLAQAGLNSQRLPVLSFTIAEDELRELPARDMTGHYAAWNYFQSIGRPENREFVRRFKSRYGEDRTTSDSIVAAYNAVKLWAQAVEEAGIDETVEVAKAIRRQSRDAPEGIISIDFETMHTWRPFYLGKIRDDGQFEIVWNLDKPVRPVPYPVLRSRGEWNSFVEKLYTTWGTSRFAPPSGGDSAAPASALAIRPGRGPSARNQLNVPRPRSYQR